MRFLFVAPRFHTNQYFIVKTLLERGHAVEFHVVYEGKSEDHSLLSPEHIEPSALYRWLARRLGKERDHEFTMKYLWPNVPSYWRQLRQVDPDVVIVRNPGHLSSLLAVVMARLMGKAIILYTQGPKHYPASPKKQLLISLLISVFRAAWITPVKGEQNARSSTHPHLHYLPFAVEPDPTLERDWFRDDTIHLLSIGKFYPRKNHLLLLEVFRELRKRYPLRLTLVGECSNDVHRDQLVKVQAYLREHDMQNTVLLKTNLRFPEVQQLYKEHDLFILPSSREPAGVSLLEAMAKGLPVLCSDSNGTRWYIERGHNGEVFASDDSSDLSDKLEQLIADRERLKAMGEKSLNLVNSEHHPSVYYARLMGILEDRFGLHAEGVPLRRPVQVGGRRT